MQVSRKSLVIALVLLLALPLLAVAIIAVTFDPNDAKPLLIRYAKEKKQRTLTIPGDLQLRLFPRLGLQVGSFSLSERNSNATFAAADSARVSLALWPLLTRKLVIDDVRIDGLELNLRRRRDGQTNADDFLAEPAQQDKSAPLAFDIDSVHITRAKVGFDDAMNQRRIVFSGLDLESGRIAPGEPGRVAVKTHVTVDRPAIDARVAIDTGYMLEPDAKHYVLNAASVDFKGRLAEFADLALRMSGNADLRLAQRRFVLEKVKFSAAGKRAAQAVEFKLDLPSLTVADDKVSGGKLAGMVRARDGQDTSSIEFSAPRFAGTPQAFQVSDIAASIRVKNAKTDAKADIQGELRGDIDTLVLSSPQLALALSGTHAGTAMEGKLVTPLRADLRARSFTLPQVQANLSLPNPGGGKLRLDARGQAKLDLARESLASSWQGKLDDSTFSAQLGMSRFTPAAYAFDITLDAIDADRYRAKAPDAGLGKPGKSGAATPAAATAAAPAAPLDLSFMRGVQADGKLHVGALKFNNLRASDVRVRLRADGARVALDPLNANLYGGKAAGTLTVSASAAPRFALKQELTDIEVGPLLQDVLGKQPIEGRGKISLDVAGNGGGFAQIKNSMNGSARLELRDGAVHGINIAQTLRGARARIDQLRGEQASQSGTASGVEKTDFSELRASFRIDNGVARNDDLQLKSPLLRVTGSGAVDLGRERLDYLARVSVVSTLKGQGGAELDTLRGLTVPVRLSGPFGAIGWRVDVKDLVNEIAGEKIEQKKEELKSRAQEAIDQEKDKLRDKLQEQFKGLLRK